MIDLSDGLSSDLAHICRASKTGAKVYADLLPTDPNLQHHFHEDYLEVALHGGEDFELLFTVSEKNISLLQGLPVTRIGEMTENADFIELIRDGKSEILQPKGYRHF